MAHGQVVLAENCPSDRCMPGSGVVYISCDYTYYPTAGSGRLICSGYNKFRTPAPVCLGIHRNTHHLSLTILFGVEVSFCKEMNPLCCHNVT